MIFTNSRTNDSNRFIKQNMNYNIKPRIVKMSTPIKTEISNSTNSTNINNTSKIDWGPAIWYFFHILAEKVKPESFVIVRETLLDTIKIICVNLPCPTCSIHAKTYMNNLNNNTIRTKDQLKQMLLNFHNEVNKRTGKPEFSLTELNEKYSKGRVDRILPVFFKFFEDKHRSVHMLSNDMYTMRVSRNIRTWLSENLQHFDT